MGFSGHIFIINVLRVIYGFLNVNEDVIFKFQYKYTFWQKYNDSVCDNTANKIT